MRSSSSSSRYALLALILWGWPSVVVADSGRTPAEATAHALAELANCRAQHRPECPTDTPTSMPTWTASPTSTSTPVPTDTPTPEPTPVLVDWAALSIDDPARGSDTATAAVEDEAIPEAIPEPTLAPSPTATPRPAPAAAESAAAPHMQVVIQTVIVTAVPTETPTSRAITATSTSSPTLTATATPTHTPTATPTPTASVVSVAGVSATRAPVGSISHVSAPAPGHWEWSAFLDYLAAAIGIVVLLVAFMTRRRVAVWKGDPHA